MMYCKGEPPAVLADIVQVKQDNLIMLGTYGRKGLNSLLIFVVDV
ncbi:MAG: hypothetical protein H6R43_816 [Nitrospirae bacterium]|nr:hypothetical protein [Nitrospirota bacterium]